MRALITMTPGPRVGPAVAIARAAGAVLVEGDVLAGLDSLFSVLSAASVDHSRPWLPAPAWVPAALRDGPEALLQRSPASYLSPALAGRVAEVRERFPGVPLLALVDCPAPGPLARPDAGAVQAWLKAAEDVLRAATEGLVTVIPLTRLHEPPVLQGFLGALGGTLSPAVLRRVAELARAQPAPRAPALPEPVLRVRAALLGEIAVHSPIAAAPPPQVAAPPRSISDAPAARWARALVRAGMDPEAAEAVAGARGLDWAAPVAPDAAGERTP